MTLTKIFVSPLHVLMVGFQAMKYVIIFAEIKIGTN